MDSSHFSRVCGHGHIKKFWLLQTKKESGSMDDSDGAGVDDGDSNGDSVKSLRSPSDLSSQLTERPTEIYRRRGISHGYGVRAGNTKRKGFRLSLSGEEEEEEEEEEEGGLGTVENTVSNLVYSVSKEKMMKRKMMMKEEKERTMAMELHRGASNSISPSSSSSCDSETSSRTCHVYSRVSEAGKEDRGCVLATDERFEEQQQADDQQEKDESHGVRSSDDNLRDADDQRGSLAVPDRGTNGSACSSPPTASIMEVEHGEDTEDLGVEKTSPTLAMDANSGVDWLAMNANNGFSGVAMNRNVELAGLALSADSRFDRLDMDAKGGIGKLATDANEESDWLSVDANDGSLGLAWNANNGSDTLAMNATDQFGRLAMNASDGSSRLPMSANDGSDSGLNNANGSDNGSEDLVSTQDSEPDKARIADDSQQLSFVLASEASRIVARAQEALPRGSAASSLQESQDRKRSPLAENLTNCNSNNTTSSLKECVLCGATKTPMWRSGPQGPKSLCNACGIRYKKYRSYPNQSDILSDPMLQPKLSSELNLKQQRKRKWHHHHHLGSAPLKKKVYGYPFQSRLRRLSAAIDAEHEQQQVRTVFAEDEEEAAVLLMYLSCGLVY